MFQESKLEEFLSELASRKPTPGGGAVSALSAALAASLNCMVLNLTTNKKTYHSYDEDTKKLIDNELKSSYKFKSDFLKYMEEDAKAFSILMDYYKLPKNNNEDIEIREMKLEEGYRGALRVPLDLAIKCVEFFDSIIISSKYGNTNVLSDSAVASENLFCALKSSIINVKINLSYIENEQFSSEINNQCDELIMIATQKKEDISKIINERK